MSPQHANYSVQSTGAKLKKKKHWDDEGVAATIGTIMTLLVFLTFLGMFTNQFLPVWMNDNESSHMAGVIGQFTTLKSTVDISISNYANSLVAPSSIYVPVTLSAAGIPVFAASTAGILTLNPKAIYAMPTFNVTYTYKLAIGASQQLNPNNDGGAGGSLQLYCPNRYYVEETLIYENGAIILNQSDGEFVIAGPQFMVKNVGSNPGLVVQLTLITIQGQNITVGGTGSKGVDANLQYASSREYNYSSSTGSKPLYLNITSKHGIAWEKYFNNTLGGAGLAYGIGKDYAITNKLTSFIDKSRNFYTLSLQIFNVQVFDYTHANVNIAIGEISMI